MNLGYTINTQKIVGIRENQDISQFDVARYMDITKAYLHEMEKGRRDMGMKYLTKYANYLEMKPSELLALLEEKR